MTTMLELRGVSSGYGDVPVTHDVDLHVDAGEVVCLLGANGAGKTTTILTISGVLPADSGSLSAGRTRPYRCSSSSRRAAS